MNHDQARIPRHQAARRHPLLRARPRAVAAVLHATSSTSPRPGAARPSSSSSGQQTSAVLRGRQHQGRVQLAGRARAAAPRASSRKHPDGVGTLIFEVEDIEQHVRAARGARRHADRRHPDVPATTAARCASSRSPRRSATCTFRFRERDGYRALFPGAVPRRRRRRHEPVRLRARSITSRRTSRR